MPTLLNLGIKVADLKANDKGYANITAVIEDTANQWGQNVSAWNQQTKEQREAGEKREYVANGKVVYTTIDGVAVPQSEKQVTNDSFQSDRKESNSDLPF
jgi:hypothetical protein